MSFFNKIIDRAKHGNHNSIKEEKSPQQQQQHLQQQPELSKGDSNRSFFGIHTPHSSTSSSHATNSMQEQPQSQLPKVQEEAGSNNNHYATGYVTPRQSQDLHQNMDIDTPGKNKPIHFFIIFSRCLTLYPIDIRANEPTTTTTPTSTPAATFGTIARR